MITFATFSWKQITCSFLPVMSSVEDSSMSAKSFLAALILLVTATGAFGAPCEREDFETKVTGESGCLLLRRYGSTNPATMVVWLHGNVSTGGPANSHFRVA